MIRYVVIFLALWSVITFGISTWRRWTIKEAYVLSKDITLGAIGAIITTGILVTIVVIF